MEHLHNLFSDTIKLRNTGFTVGLLEYSVSVPCFHFCFVQITDTFSYMVILDAYAAGIKSCQCFKSVFKRIIT